MLPPPFERCSTATRALAPGAPFLMGFHAGDERRHVGEWFGVRVELDWHFFPVATVVAALELAGLAIEARVERAACADEYPTSRGYVLARKR